MDTSLPSFLRYMKRFKNTFDAHPQHSRKVKPEYIFTALYPVLHAWFPVYQKYLQMRDVNPAERIWIKEQMQLIEEDKLEDISTYEDSLADADGRDASKDGSGSEKPQQ
jgi:hypothetical protein